MKKNYILSIFILLAMMFAIPDTAQAVKWSSYKVSIDPGHGGNDPGALGPTSPHEAALALTVSLDIRTRLQAVGCAVTMTRTTNATLSLTARRSHFLAQDPWIACSIHLNAFNGSAHGTETWYYWSAGNSLVLAQRTQARLVQQLGRANRGVKQNGWTVITASSTIPSILTEGLFVDNPTEHNMLKVQGSTGQLAWRNGHLYGFWDHLKSFNANLDNPVASTPPPASPTISASPLSLALGNVNVNATKTGTFTVTGKDLTGNISVSSSTGAFTVSPTSLGKTGGTVTVTFKPTTGGAQNATITLSGGGASAQRVSVSGTGVIPPITFTQGWNFSETSGAKKDWATDFSKIRNLDYSAGKLYVVSEGNKIVVVNAQTGNKLGELSNHNVGGGAIPLIDVRMVSDGKIIASNVTTSTSSPLKVYVWDNDNSHPKVLLETTNFGPGISRIGDCVGILGDTKNGELYFASPHSDTFTRVIKYKITNGVASTTPTVVKLVDADDKGMIFGLSPRVQPNVGGRFWVTGQNYYPSLYEPNGELYATANPAAFNTVPQGNGFKAFTFKGVSYGVGTTYAPGTGENSIKAGRFTFFNATNGWAGATKIAEYPTAGLGSTRNTSFSTSITANVSGDAGVEVWVLVHNQGVAYFKHGTPAAQNPSAPNPPSLDPLIKTSPASLAFSAQATSSDAKTLTITGENLDGNINLSVSGTNASLFTLSAGSVAKAGGSVTVTYKPTAAGSHSATLTLSSTGATNKTVALTGTATAPPSNDPTLTTSLSSLSFSAEANSSQAKTVSVTGTNVTGNISLSLSGANASLFSISPASLNASGGSVTVTYKPTSAGSHSATLTASASGAGSKTVALTGSASAQVVYNYDISFNEVWNYSQISGKTANWISTGSQVTQDMAFHDGKLYVVHRTDNNDNKIYIVNAYTGAKIGELNTAACTTGTYFISSIAVIGGKVIACNLAAGAASPLVVYKWENDGAAATKWLETTSHADVRAGDLMDVSGDMTNGKVWFGYNNKVYYYKVTNGSIATSPTVINLKKGDSDYNSGALALVGISENSDGSFWATGKDLRPSRFNSSGVWQEDMGVGLVNAPHGTNTSFFSFGDKQYVVVADYQNKTNASLAEGSAGLIDVTGGIASASRKGYYPSVGLGNSTVRNTSFRSRVLTHVAGDKAYMWVHMPHQGAAHYMYDAVSVGLEEASQSSSMQVFASRGILQVRGVEAAQIDIYTMTGQLVKSELYSNELPVDELRGVYMVMVKDVEGNNNIAKIIIR